MTIQQFTDRNVTLGLEKRFRLTNVATGEVIEFDIEKLGIEAEGTSLSAANLNPLVNHVNDANLHMTRIAIEERFSSLENRVGLIESTFPDSFTNNLFTEDLTTLNAIVLTKGYYNEAQSRLEV